MSLSYFFFFAALGVSLPFLTPALLDLGYSKAEAGLIVGLTYGFNMVVPILGGRLTDRFFTLDQTIRLGSVLMALAAAGLWFLSKDPGPLLLACLLLYSAARAPMVSLQDALAMMVARDQPGAYGRMRMIGSLGFALGTTLFAYIVEARGMDVFWLGLLVVSLAFALQSLFLPISGQREESSVDPHFWRNLDRNWWLWLLAMALHWTAFGPFHYGFTLLLLEQGVAEHLTGWYWSLGIVAEIGMFLLSARAFSLFSVRSLLLLAMGANLVRWILVGLFPTPFVLAGTQLLHAFGFGLFYAAAMSAITRYSSGRNRASYQGLFSSCVGGAGAILGNILAGWLHQQMPLYQVFFLCAPLQACAMVLLWFNPLRVKNRHI